MKKITLLLCAVLLAFTACHGNQNENQSETIKEYTINGHIDDSYFEGKTVYLYDITSNEKTAIDSTTVTNGTFTFKNTIGTSMLAAVIFEDGYQMLLVLEPGEIYVDLLNDSLSGTALNDKLYQFQKYTFAFSEEVGKAYDNALMDDDESMQNFELMYEEKMKEFNEKVAKYYDENKTNILGVFFISCLEELTYEQMKNMLKDAAPEVVNNQYVQKRFEILKNMESTRVGQKYVDVDVVDFSTDKAAKLSDYVEGKIALIDFWASWCRPCRIEIPNIAKIYKKYGDKIAVIGMNVWDDPDSQADAIELLKMNWIQLADRTEEHIVMNTYGVEGIPQIMLIGADGTILARDLRGDEIEEAVKKALE